MLIIILSLFILITAILHIRAELLLSTQQIYLFKSTSTSLIILLACLAGDFEHAYHYLIVAGLFFSLFGDVLLINSKGFLAGLISFFIAHVFYIAAFIQNKSLDTILYLPTALPFLIFAFLILTLIYSGLHKLKVPVILYLLVIVIMGWQALNQYIVDSSVFHLSAVIGASLFMISDSLIAINKFKKPIKHERLAIMSTYYLGQWLIALSVLGLN